MLAASSMLRALTDLEAARADNVAVAAAAAAGPVVMNAQLDLAERTGAFDQISYCRLGLQSQIPHYITTGRRSSGGQSAKPLLPRRHR
jgi:hypothetical protein